MADEGRQTGTQPRSQDASASANQSKFNIDIVASLVPKSRGGKIAALILLVLLVLSYKYNFLHFTILSYFAIIKVCYMNK